MHENLEVLSILCKRVYLAANVCRLFDIYAFAEFFEEMMIIKQRGSAIRMIMTAVISVGRMYPTRGASGVVCTSRTLRIRR